MFSDITDEYYTQIEDLEYLLVLVMREHGIRSTPKHVVAKTRQWLKKRGIDPERPRPVYTPPPPEAAFVSAGGERRVAPFPTCTCTVVPFLPHRPVCPWWQHYKKHEQLLRRA